MDTTPAPANSPDPGAAVGVAVAGGATLAAVTAAIAGQWPAACVSLLIALVVGAMARGMAQRAERDADHQLAAGSGRVRNAKVNSNCDSATSNSASQ